MKILGELKPVINKAYKYSLFSEMGIPVLAYEWEIQYKGRSIKKTKVGLFTFATNLGGQSVKLIAKTKQKGKLISYYSTIDILVGQPRILKLEWQDKYNREITNGTKVGYTDIVKLVIKTANIPIGETLSVTVYEDEYADGHDKSSRDMGTLPTRPVNKYGYARITFNNIQFYQRALNNADYINESEHEFYVKVHYRSHIDRIEDQIQLIIQNKTESFIKPPVTNNPVVVAVPQNTETKSDKKKVDVTFNMFFDGTMNNMTNTNEGRKKSTVFYNKSDQKDDSYTNYYSNVALLYMHNKVNVQENVIKIYTEGIGTADGKADQAMPGGAFGTSISLYMRGIKAKVSRGLNQMEEYARKIYFKNNLEIGKVTINVFGFSRGAAGARYFISKADIIQLNLKLKKKTDIIFNFVGLFDTVASHGVIHINDVRELKLKLGNTMKKVVQLAAADEYRSNFKLTDITSSIKAGVGYQLTMPGVHSDIGGGYSKILDEKRYLGEHLEYGDGDHDAKKKFEKIKKEYISKGWYRDEQFIVEKKRRTNISMSDTLTFSTLHTLYGLRKGIQNTYQYIPFAIMKKFSEEYAVMTFDVNTDILNDVNNELQSMKQQLYKYAISNDGMNDITVSPSEVDLLWLRNRYLHRSNLDDEPLTFAGRYDKNGKPDRDILEG